MTSATPIRVGLMGYGRAGQAVARVLGEADAIDLRWIYKRSPPEKTRETGSAPALLTAAALSPADLLAQHPVDMIVDFSSRESIHAYGALAAARNIGIISAVSDYHAEDLALIERLAATTVIMASPNITLGINYLMLASRVLQQIAPFADIEIIEQHFRAKAETSGTALRLAKSLGLSMEQVNSIRVGGIVGHHEVVFGFPYQTVRLVHESISREAFGTGAVFALKQLIDRPPGLYTYEQLLHDSMRSALVSLSESYG